MNRVSALVSLCSFVYISAGDDGYPRIQVIDGGNALSRLIAANVTPDKLPNGKLYYNIANTFLTGSLRDNYDLINLTAQAVQESIDNKNGIMIEPQKAEFPADRVHAIVNAVSDETADWSTIERRLDSPVRNVTESFYNDYVEANAEFRSDAGLRSYIIRETDGNCCAWCSSLAGQYEYPNDIPPDVYARHDNCTCTVTYVTDKYRQDVWSKKIYALTPEERKEILEQTPKPERFTRQQAKDVEKSNLKDAVGVANSGESGTKSHIDVKSEYERNATPGIGIIKYDEGYRTDLHKEEIEFANWLHNFYGGDIYILNEINKDKVPTPDYLWNNKLWDLKTTQTEKAANSAIRKGLKQIESNPGGIILNYGNLDVSMKKLQEAIDKRMQWYKGESVDIMIVNKRKVVKILRYKKT